MSVRPILVLPDPRLRAVADPVDKIDDGIKKLAKDMLDTMYAAPGIGLAATQIGEMKRVVVMDLAKDGEPPAPMVMINPEIVKFSDEIEVSEEGCLSIPELSIDCIRAKSVVAAGLNMHGDPVVIEGSDYLARALQHETDHLDGILFVDRLDTEARKSAMKAIRESDWFGQEQPTVKLSPHDTRGFAI